MKVSKLALNLTYCSRKITTSRLSKSFSTAVEPDTSTQPDDSKMMAWQIHSYGGLEELQLSKSARVPPLMKPNDVLVKVSSASVNPIDLAVIGGYGNKILNTMRQVEACSLSPQIEFPMTLGRDFCGRVIGKGLAVKKVDVGDVVWGTVPPHNQGSHAEKVIVKDTMVHRKPSTLNDLEAGSMLYAGVTAWSALKITGDFFLIPTYRKRVLVLGGSGGVGLMAVQLLKAWGSQVITTCRSDAVPLLESFGVDCVIDYTQPDTHRAIREEGKYDLILDCAGIGSDVAPAFADCLKEWNFAKFITLKSPMMRNVDNYGLVGGMMRNALDLLVPNIKTLQTSKSSTVRWAFYAPLPQAVEEITSLVEQGKLCPTIEKAFPFKELPAAYQRMAQGHLRGKIVISREDNGTEHE